MRGLRLTLLGVSCAICHRRERRGHKLEPHHIDGKKHNNHAWNMAFAHKSCHLELSRLNQQFRNPRDSLAIDRDARSKSRERENISSAGPPGAGWSDTPWANREGEKHEVMRERWNAWIIDKQNGPFHAEGMRVRKADLAPILLLICHRAYCNYNKYRLLVRSLKLMHQIVNNSWLARVALKSPMLEYRKAGFSCQAASGASCHCLVILLGKPHT